MADYPTVSVIILNWNGRAFLADCLAALQKQDYPRFEVTLIDNASTDDSVAFVRTHFPGVTIRVNPYNLGFAAGNNVALREVTADIIVLLNPDVVVKPDWLRQLVAPFLSEPAIAVAGCKLLYPDGKLLNHAGGQILLPQAMPRHIGGKEIDSGQHDTLRDVEYVIGAAMAIRRDSLSHIGLFDEAYFLYYEDVDFCFAARRAGYRVVVVPQAVAIHVESAVAIKGSFSYLRRFHYGRWRFLLKHFSAETILADTMPAEQKWLAAVGYTERLAAAFAYEAISISFPSLWQARSASNQSVSPADQDKIQAAFKAIQNFAWGPPLLPPPAAGQPSTSPTTTPLLARLRTAWNHIVPRQFASQSAEQNYQQELLARQLAAYESVTQQQRQLLRELAAAEAHRQREVAELWREIGRLRQHVPEQVDIAGN